MPSPSYASPPHLLQKNGKGTAKVATTNHFDAEREFCPQCGKKYSRTDVVVLLNSSQDEQDAIHEAMGRKRLLGPVKKPKSSKKRKNDSPMDDAEHPAKKQVAVGPSMKISAASQAVVSGLAMEEVKAKMSDAAKSLYGNGMKRKETLMTLGTFARVRLPSGFEYDEALLIQSNIDPPIPLRPTSSANRLSPETADQITALRRRRASTSTSEAARSSSWQG